MPNTNVFTGMDGSITIAVDDTLFWSNDTETWRCTIARCDATRALLVAQGSRGFTSNAHKVYFAAGGIVYAIIEGFHFGWSGSALVALVGCGPAAPAESPSPTQTATTQPTTTPSAPLNRSARRRRFFTMA